MEKQPTIQDVLDVLSDFAGNVDQRFEKIDQRFEKIDQHFEKIDQRFDRVEERLDRVENRLGNIESTMVTKNQFTGLLDVLRENKVMSNYEVKQVKAVV